MLLDRLESILGVHDTVGIEGGDSNVADLLLFREKSEERGCHANQGDGNYQCHKQQRLPDKLARKRLVNQVTEILLNLSKQI